MPASQAMRGDRVTEREVSRGRGRRPREAADRPNFVALSLADLMVDASSSVVIQTGGDMLVIELSDYGEVARRGIAPEGTKTQHFNVSGMDFCQFMDGTRIYYAADEVRLVLLPQLGPPTSAGRTAPSQPVASQRP